MHDQVVGPFMFAKKIITGITQLDMLKFYVFPQIDGIEREKEITVIFQ